MSYNHRNFITKFGNKIIVDEEKLDIFWEETTLIPKWQPTVNISTYSSLKTLVVDIETAGINPRENRIYAIGCMSEMGKVSIFMDISESKILISFLKHLEISKLDVIYTYNGTEFDLPFIITRCELHGIAHPFRIASRTRTIGTAQVHGTPLTIREVFIRNSLHIDIYICVLRWDFVAKSLTNGRSLKQAVLEMGLRSQARLVLSYEEILVCWKAGWGSEGWQKIKEYLTYDLEDTQLIASRLVPSYYYEALVVPGMNLQQLALAGNGTKWERIFEHHYQGIKPKPDRKYKFQGGIAYSVPGLYKKVGYIDISSMYPNAILSFGIVSCKDTDRIGLSILQYLVKEKSRLEQLAKTGDIVAKEKRESTKVLANSQFGFFGTSELAFNDMEAAALVTAYGRRILQFMIEVINQAGAVPIEVDTDGVFFTHPNVEEVYAILQSQLPKGIIVKLEFIAEAMFIPERGTKNYLLWLKDGRIIRKGSWRSRSRSKLEKEFPVEYLTYFIQNQLRAEEHYKNVKSQISSRDYPKDKLAITRKIREGEKELLKLGKPGDIVTYYYSIQGVTNIKSSQNYSSQYYLNLLAQKRLEILQIANPQMLDSRKQLTLF
ncbi:DNA polymerase I (plasmid) [Brasilonema octagenarum UFV-E1]|uniref:DNA-directed DNA polymerase n=2 Tax=Brasilonema TaxID=383614 RepID=A0A856MSQ9_9CYAN|nr:MULTISPECIES: 3'-5' exonuclease [Brasilonema]NMF65948.1 DNA polymerase I [Brasilonema octagenarum UFV-OR1]QDL12711.1 DNA polymerase I [Brasilonema sennae CENA114]QDL19106.1 DNA polymerase I [Brasilonema octagenarum UFV-E1]